MNLSGLILGKVSLVTLPSVTSETWVMYSSAVPGFTVICGLLFLKFSFVSIETVANFLLFFNVALIVREKLDSCEDSIDFSFY